MHPCMALFLVVNPLREGISFYAIDYSILKSNQRCLLFSLWKNSDLPCSFFREYNFQDAGAAASASNKQSGYLHWDRCEYCMYRKNMRELELLCKYTY